MNTQLRILLILFCLLFALPSATYSDVISGVGTLNLGGWDFSDSTTVPPQGADIAVGIVGDPPIGWIVGRSSPVYEVVVMLPDSVYEDMRYAPEDLSVYSNLEPADVGVTYAVITIEGHYAKFRFLHVSYTAQIIEFVYQPDGSRKLFDPIGIESYTWGAIKKIFH